MVEPKAGIVFVHTEFEILLVAAPWTRHWSSELLVVDTATMRSATPPSRRSLPVENRSSRSRIVAPVPRRTSWLSIRTGRPGPTTAPRMDSVLPVTRIGVETV